MDEKSDSFQKKMGEPTVGSSGSMHHYYDRLLLFASSLFMSDLSEYIQSYMKQWMQIYRRQI